jgi:TRAP-type C4-dicarboxylate transport system permease small subunit
MAAPDVDPAAGEGDREAAELFATDLDLRRPWTMLPEIVAAACAAAIPVVVSIRVVARYTDWYHAFWADDVVKVLFLWLVFLGGALAVKYEAHVRMALVSDRLERAGPPWRWWAEVIVASPLVAGVLLLVLGFELVTISMRRELPSLEISAGYFMTIVPISGALMTFYVLRNLWRRHRRAPTAPGFDAGAAAAEARRELRA